MQKKALTASVFADDEAERSSAVLDYGDIVQERVYLETGVILTGVGVYSYNTSDNESARMRNRIFEQVMSHDWALQFHGFYVDSEEKELRFDVVMSFDVDHTEALKTLYDEIGSLYPDYHLQITADVDVTD